MATHPCDESRVPYLAVRGAESPKGVSPGRTFRQQPSGLRRRQEHAEHASVTFFTFGFEPAAVGPDNAEGGGEAQTRALPDAFRREEGVEDALEYVTGHAKACVSDDDLVVAPGPQTALLPDGLRGDFANLSLIHI